MNLIALTLMLTASPATATETRACLDALLSTGVVTALAVPTTHHLRTGDVYLSTGAFVLAFESKYPIHLGTSDSYRIRVWDTDVKSWPGAQPQVIQILNAAGVVVGAKLVGGSPMMLRAWTGIYDNRLLVFIRCRVRNRGKVHPTFIYEIDEKFNIKESGIHLDPEEVEAEEREVRDDMKRLRESHR